MSDLLNVIFIVATLTFIVTCYFLVRAQRKVVSTPVNVIESSEALSMGEDFDRVAQHIGQAIKVAERRFELAFERAMNEREHHSAKQLIALTAAILEAGDRANAGDQQPHRDDAGGYYAERAMELVIAAEAAIDRDKQEQQERDMPGPHGEERRNLGGRGVDLRLRERRRVARAPQSSERRAADRVPS